MTPDALSLAQGLAARPDLVRRALARHVLEALRRHDARYVVVPYLDALAWVDPAERRRRAGDPARYAELVVTGTRVARPAEDAVVATELELVVLRGIGRSERRDEAERLWLETMEGDDPERPGLVHLLRTVRDPVVDVSVDPDDEPVLVGLQLVEVGPPRYSLQLVEPTPAGMAPRAGLALEHRLDLTLTAI